MPQLDGGAVAVSTTDTDKGDKPWFSSDPEIAAIDGETGALTPEQTGDLIIGFIMSEDPYSVKGNKVTVYPATEALAPQYSIVDGKISRPSGSTVGVQNLDAIQAAAGESGSTIAFSKSGGASVISAIDASSGTLTFSGADNAAADAQVNLSLTKTVPEGVLVTHSGSVSFSAVIGEAPAVTFVSAETVNTPTDVQASQVKVKFSDTITAGAGNAKDGFTITKNGATPLTIQSAAINIHTITFTLTGSVIVYGDTVQISYDAAAGAITNGTPLASFNDNSVTNNLPDLTPGPAIVSAHIDGAVRTDAVKLVVTYDKPAILNNATGFSISNYKAGIIGLSSPAVDATSQTITFTLSRIPVWSEISAATNKLTLTYNGAAGNVKDSEQRPGLGGSAEIAFTNFDAATYEPPAVTSVALDGSAPTSLVITYSEELAGNAGRAGFSLSSGTETISFTSAALSTTTLTLTMSRAPFPAELSGLRLSYNAANGNIADASGNIAESFTNHAVTVTNNGMFVAPPEVTGVVIAQSTPTTVAITFDEVVTATSAAGFTISGSSTAASFTSLAGIGTNTLSLTINLKPAYGESLTLGYNQANGNVKSSAANINLASFTGKAITLSGFAEATDKRPVVQSITVDATTPADEDEAKKLIVVFDKTVTANNFVGFSVSGSSTAETITAISGSGTTTLTLTLNDWPSYSESGAFKLSYDRTLGSVKDANNNLCLSFSNQPVTFAGNYTGLPNNGENADTILPRLVNAVVANNTKNIVTVTFSEPVTAVANQFVVKVNTTATTSVQYGTSPVMDFSATTRNVLAASAAAGSDDKVWNLTMAAEAKYGEILRLATTAAGAAADKAGRPNELPIIPQFIIRNEVKRVKESYENEAGLYRNGNKVTAVTGGAGGDALYQNAIDYLAKRSPFNTTGVQIAAGDFLVIVLDSNQVYAGLADSPTFTSVQLAELTPAPTLILTTVTGNTQDFTITVTGNGEGLVIRNGLTLVIDEHVVMTRDPNSYGSNQIPLLSINDGGKLILDGGALKGNRIASSTTDGAKRAGAIRAGGGSKGAYILINSGEISGNIVNVNDSDHRSHGAAGAIYFYQFAVFVMHGGTISGNTLNMSSSNWSAPMAGGVAASVHYVNYHGGTTFFMTGGEISGNTVTGANTAASAGGVIVSATFQKNGGTIYGDDAGDVSKRNTTTQTGGTVKKAAVVVVNAAAVNPAAGLVTVRNDTTGPNDSLFVDGYKTGSTTAGTNDIPAWAQSFWDTTN